MARYETEFKESGRVIARARGSRPDAVLESLTEQIDEKYPGGKKRVWKTKKQ